jgi:hypothetical protein
VSEYFYARIMKLGAESQNIQGMNQGLPTTMSQANAWRRITIYTHPWLQLRLRKI